MDNRLFDQLLSQEIKQMCQIALSEDLAGLEPIDITAELIDKDKMASARLITREKGVLCGAAWFNQVFTLLGGQVTIDWQVKDGDIIEPGTLLCTLTGNARQLLTGERTAMNFLQSLSGTASITAQYVAKLGNSSCRLLDTRKTVPGMRFGQKYAVTCGGGFNHRIGLTDAYLIKENHILSCGGILNALAAAKKSHPDKLLEIEVETIEELELALQGGAQVIMLDNFELVDMKKAKTLRDNHPNKAKLEASGNVELATIAAIAATGVDYISVGALTKNIQAIDLSMRVVLE